MGVKSLLTWLLLFSPDVALANRTAPVCGMTVTLHACLGQSRYNNSGRHGVQTSVIPTHFLFFSISKRLFQVNPDLPEVQKLQRKNTFNIIQRTSLIIQYFHTLMTTSLYSEG